MDRSIAGPRAGRVWWAFLAGCLLSSIAFSLAGVAQGQPPAPRRVHLDATIATGDRVAVSLSEDGDIVATVYADGVPPEIIGRYSNRNVQYIDRVVAADATGQPTSVTRKYLLARGRSGTAENTGRMVPEVLEGKTVSIQRLGSQVAFSGAPEAVATIRHEFEDAVGRGYGALVGDGDRMVGDSWPLTPVMAAVLMHNGEGTGTIRFVGIVDRQGQECARLAVDATVHAVNELGWRTTLEIHGDLFSSIRDRRLVSASFRSKCASSYQTRRGARVIRLDGTGTISTEVSYRWLAVAGRPIAQDGAAGKRPRD